MELCFFASMRVTNNARSAIVHAVFKHAMYSTRGGGASAGGGDNVQQGVEVEQDAGGARKDVVLGEHADHDAQPAIVKESRDSCKADSRAADASSLDRIGTLSNLMSTDADKLGKMPWIIFSFSQQTWAICSFPLV
ncbi:unnamed protein product, partial [Amoebophrya sp. A25]|eukprot:GSA25T00023856001.1